MKDLISRQAAIKAFYIQSDDDGWWVGTAQDAETLLNGLPTAERVGKWIHDGKRFESGNDWWHCSECGYTDVLNRHNLPNYCPNCGARMVEGEEDEAD